MTCKKVAKPLPEHKEFYSIHQEIGTDLPTIASKISGYNTLAYLDTCARASIASRELYFHLLDTQHPFEDIMVTITLADGSKSTKLVSRTTTTISIGGRTNPIQFIVIPGAIESKTLLGADFIKAVGIIPNLIQDAWCFNDDLSKWFLFDYVQGGPNELTHPLGPQQVNSLMPPPMYPVKTPRRKRMKFSKTTKQYFTCDQSTQENEIALEQFQPVKTAPSTPARTISVSIKIPGEVMEPRDPIERNDSVNIVLEEITCLGEVLMAEEILKRFSSPSYHPKMISPIGSTPKAKKSIEDHHDIPYFEPTTEKLNEAKELQIFSIDLTLRDDEGAKLNDGQKEKINAIIDKYLDVFNETGPPTDQAIHRIETLNHLPIATAPYRLPSIKREALKTEIQAMLDGNVIEESESPWATNVVMKKKPNGKWRICIDYRRLNEITIADKYPLPLIDDLLQDARGSL